MTKQTLLTPFAAVESSARKGMSKPKKHLNAATLHFFELLKRA